MEHGVLSTLLHIPEERQKWLLFIHTAHQNQVARLTGKKKSIVYSPFF
jgi:hypothetical protein